MSIQLTFTQCKQLINNGYDLRDVVEQLNNQPVWVEQLELSTIQAVQQGGCASGAYMPAVTYYDANNTMSRHGDDVLYYIFKQLGELPEAPEYESWSGMAVHYLSVAVELWCNQFDLNGVDWN